MPKGLDKDIIYNTRDEQETFWRFEYKSVGDITSWWAFRKRPEDDKYLCIGVQTQTEIQKFLKQHKYKLTADDLIDLEIVMKDWAGQED